MSDPGSPPPATPLPTPPPTGFPTPPPTELPTPPPTGFPTPPPTGFPTQPATPLPTPPAAGFPTPPVDFPIASAIATPAPEEDLKTWTGGLRRRALRDLPPDKLLPDRQPAYVASWIYVFGALTLGAFGVVILSGAIIAVRGPAWWHVSRTGLFINSLHLWSTELFFFFMVVHLWGKFFMAAWRGRRRATWITGVLAFVMSIATAFTGYLSQQNFASEWVGTQAKDGINATGAGAFWNVLDFGQMLLWHVVLLPLVVAVIIGVHVLLVRRRGVVPPFEVAGQEPTAFRADEGARL